jgi:hypothetical protein
VAHIQEAVGGEIGEEAAGGGVERYFTSESFSTKDSTSYLPLRAAGSFHSRTAEKVICRKSTFLRKFGLFRKEQLPQQS